MIRKVICVRNIARGGIPSQEGQDHFPSDPIEFTQSVALGRLSDEACDHRRRYFSHAHRR